MDGHFVALVCLEPGAGVASGWLRFDGGGEKRRGVGAAPAFPRQGAFVPLPAQQAGIRINDVIVGVDGKQLELTFRQFDAFMRLNYRVGDEVTYQPLARAHWT